MSRKHFPILLALAALAIVAVTLLVPQQTGRESAPGEALLLPDLGQTVNQAQSLRLRGAGGASVSLKREDRQWVIEDLHDYPADWAGLRKVLADLAQARVVEGKTDNPAYYPRLGVADIDSPDGADGVEIALTAGGRMWAVIAGHPADGRDGQYVRILGQPRSVLIDRSLDAALDPVDWAAREVVDIAAGTVAELEIIHPDGDWILARKQAAGDADFVLESLPEGREVVSSWSVNSLANALTALRMDSVRPAGDEAVDAAVKFRLLTFGGVEYIVQAWQEGEDCWVALHASMPPATAASATEPEAEAGAADAATAAVATDIAAPLQEDPAAQAAAFNERAGGWFFRIPDYKYDSLTKRLDALLKPVQEAAGD